MANKPYENIVFDREISLAIENVMVAEYGTATWDPTRVADILNPPSGFRWLGAVVEDTPQMTVSREKFQLRTGIPQVLQYEAVTTVAGRFEAQLYTHSPWKVQYALGNVPAHNIMADGSSPSSVQSGSSPTAYQFTLTASPVVAYNVNDFIVVSANTLAISDNVAQISSISGLTIVVGTPGFPVSPAPNDDVAKIDGVKSPFGTNRITTYTVLGIAEFIDGTQVVHAFDRMAPSAEFAEAVRPDDVGKIPIAFEAYGVSNAEFGSSQLIVGKRYWFPPETT